MKPLLMIPALLLAACAPRAPRPATLITATPTGKPVPSTSLRTSEQLREYRFGRYVDPSDPLVMHEGHPVYRVETSAGWDLRPGSSATRQARAQATATSISTNDAVVAEVNKQRAATRAFTAQAATLNERLAGMQQATAQAEELAKQNLALKRELAGLRARMDASDAQARERKPTAPAQPASRNDDQW